MERKEIYNVELHFIWDGGDVSVLLGDVDVTEAFVQQHGKKELASKELAFQEEADGRSNDDRDYEAHKDSILEACS